MTAAHESPAPPLVTAVIPTFRRPRLLARAMESVLAQSEPRIEVFVSDNASGDETADVLEAFAARDSRVRFVVQAENLGALANFQACVEHVRTPWVSLLSDDDALLPGFYAHALARLAAHPQARFFAGHVVRWRAEDGRHGLHPSSGWEERLYAAGEATALMASRLLTWTGCVFATEIFDVLGPMRPDTFADALFQIRAAAAYPFVVSLRSGAVFTNWGEGALRTMDGAELAARAAATFEALCADPAVSREARAAMRPYWEGLPASTLIRRLKASVRESDDEAFVRAAADLHTLGGLGLGGRWLLFAGRRRRTFPFLARLLRHHLLRRRARRHGAGASLSFEEVLTQYAGADAAATGRRPRTGC